MIKRYCDINYRGYLLEIEQNKYVLGKFSYKGSSRDKVLFLGFLYTIPQVINKLISAVDSILGEREKKEEILFCTVIYQKYELKIWLKEDLSYMAWIDNFDFASWGENWSIEKLASIIEAFRNKVDSGAGEDLINTITDYKGHRLVVKKKKDSDKYIGISTLLEGRWRGEGYSVDWVVKQHQRSVDRILESNKMTEKTYEEVRKEWNGNYKRINYKDQELVIYIIRQVRNSREFTYNRAFYVGELTYTPKNEYWSERKSFESIHYDKVISKFERFVDECCTDWQAKRSFSHKGYEVQINQEKDKEFYFGYVPFHKNSTYKHLADNIEEVERCCKNRIGKVVYEKEKANKTKNIKSILASGAKKHKIREIEQLITKLSTQLEELKNEKDTLTYKEVVLEISKSNSGSYYGTLKDITKPAPFIADNLEDLQKSFERYVDRLEGQYLLFCRLTGRN